MNILKKSYILIATLTLGLLSMPTYSDIETPSYTVIEQQKPFEIRRYEPMLIAEVTVNGNRKKAATKGFKLLADYIFGNNQSQIDMPMILLHSRNSQKKPLLSFSFLVGILTAMYSKTKVGLESFYAKIS